MEVIHNLLFKNFEFEIARKNNSSLSLRTTFTKFQDILQDKNPQERKAAEQPWRLQTAGTRVYNRFDSSRQRLAKLVGLPRKSYVQDHGDLIANLPRAYKDLLDAM